MNNNPAALYVPGTWSPDRGYISRATFGAHRCLMGMANLRAGPGTGDDAATGVGGLFRARYPEMVRLADLLGADDPEDIAQEAFARLIRRHDTLRDPDAALAYVRSIVCNLTRNRHRHLRVVRLRTPFGRHEDSSEQAAILNEEHREVLAARRRCRREDARPSSCGTGSTYRNARSPRPWGSHREP